MKHSRYLTEIGAQGEAIFTKRSDGRLQAGERLHRLSLHAVIVRHETNWAEDGDTWMVEAVRKLHDRLMEVRLLRRIRSGADKAKEFAAEKAREARLEARARAMRAIASELGTESHLLHKIFSKEELEDELARRIDL